MNYIEQGHGAPLVLIPGLQGRWEYTRATVDALSKDFRVISFSLGDEPTAQFPFEPGRGLDSYADQVGAALEATNVPRAIICGVSFGGLIALRYAAKHPQRVDALILASTPGPGWRLRPRHDLYARFPWIFGPMFLLEIPFRARHELEAALPRREARHAFGRMMLGTLAKAPVSLTRMARRARLIASYTVDDCIRDCTRIEAPTLVVTGEAALDHVVPVGGSSRYSELIAGATRSVLERTGHQGTLTRPEAFTATVQTFVAGIASAQGDRPRAVTGAAALEAAPENDASKVRSGRVA